MKITHSDISKNLIQGLKFTNYATPSIDEIISEINKVRTFIHDYSHDDLSDYQSLFSPFSDGENAEIIQQEIKLWLNDFRDTHS